MAALATAALILLNSTTNSSNRSQEPLAMATNAEDLDLETLAVMIFGFIMCAFALVPMSMMAYYVATYLCHDKRCDECQWAVEDALAAGFITGEDVRTKENPLADLNGYASADFDMEIMESTADFFKDARIE